MPTPHDNHSSVSDSFRRADVDRLLSHLDAQEAALLALKNLLVDVGRDPDDDAQRRRLKVRMDAADQLCSGLVSDCDLLLRTLARSCGRSPEQFSIRDVIRSVGGNSGLAQQLREARRRLLRLTWQVQRVSESTAWVLSERQRVRHAVFEMAGGQAASDRYDASGRKALSTDALRYGRRS
ncbi:MAG: hypothetical protein RIK87_12750 [Fuerstiella sp.]